jgi:hemolysin III
MTGAPTVRRGLARAFREPANALTHLIGLLLAAIGAVALAIVSVGDPWRFASMLVFGVSLVLLYTASTLLHGVRAGPGVIERLRVFDHAAIFVLIAGTYTPITLVSLRIVHPAWSWALFGTVWGLAVLGVAFKLFWIGAPRWLSVTLYVALGWLALVAAAPLLSALPVAALAWLLAGGVCYTGGAIVYATKRPDPWPRSFGFHALWHLCVLAGSACHFVLVLAYVALA